ncbi:hypothetical protein [Streptomyces sp. YS415]|uniref:hypothetical protein n=1 Tax=Streptomyces sp. YS415 TaxID=2944806 RepID=UPI0020218E78|nr:hypothetical protein [Streptomyces sp. YS415]MCL7428985.1 hypothetical protein [Streptomyces sp. YS415]
MREFVNALRQGRSGGQWDLPPHDLPPRGAVMSDLERWQVREKALRKVDPSLVVLDPQHAAAGALAEPMGP